VEDNIFCYIISRKKFTLTLIGKPPLLLLGRRITPSKLQMPTWH